jgi:hypothetical protein
MIDIVELKTYFKNRFISDGHKPDDWKTVTLNNKGYHILSCSRCQSKTVISQSASDYYVTYGTFVESSCEFKDRDCILKGGK